MEGKNTVQSLNTLEQISTGTKILEPCIWPWERLAGQLQDCKEAL
jgi:hypothetical protein